MRLQKQEEKSSEEEKEIAAVWPEVLRGLPQGI